MPFPRIEGQGSRSTYQTDCPRNPPNQVEEPSMRESYLSKLVQERPLHASRFVNQSVATNAQRAAVTQRVPQEAMHRARNRQHQIQRVTLNRDHLKQLSVRRVIPVPCRRNGVNVRKQNLRLRTRIFHRLCKSHNDALIRNFKQRLKRKDYRSYAMMCRLSTLLVGTVYETQYIYRGCVPYCGYIPGFVRIAAKPNFRATRLFIEQVLHCRSNALIERIRMVIDQAV